MSIIIRLQNLPVTAKSADIRNFFGGLRIPDGGVHILGGKNGDAFIGFNSDEDARLAMRKDGGKINDSRIKLFLSSRMEMQYEVEKLTKCGIDNSPSHKSCSQERTLADEDSRYISSEGMVDSQSPDQSVDRSVNFVQHDQVSQFPAGFGSRPRTFIPRKRSRSSRRAQSSPKSVSPDSKVSRRMPNYVNLRQIDLKQDKSDSSDPNNYIINPENKPSTSEIQAELERRITEAIEKNSAIMARGNIEYQESGVPGFTSENMHVDCYPGQNFSSGIVPTNFPPYPPPPLFDNIQPFHAPPFQHSYGMNIGQQHVINMDQPHLMNMGHQQQHVMDMGQQQHVMDMGQQQHAMDMGQQQHAMDMGQQQRVMDMGQQPLVMDMGQQPRVMDMGQQQCVMDVGQQRVRDMEQQHVPSPISHPDKLMASDKVVRQKSINGFYVTISGLDLLWDFKEIQIMLKGIYAPQNNIRWEIDDTGLKTGTAFVKLMNRDDFDKVLRRMTFFFDGRRITVSECPDFLSYSYFSSTSEYQNEHMDQNHDLCYKLKGLPFACTYEDIISFFKGFVVADVIIIYGKDNKATGTGFVSFSNRRDFEQALQLNGEKILHRYIEMMPCSEREMMKVKRMHPSAQTFTSYSQILVQKNLPPSRRPLCAVITGLPFHTSIKKLATFFSDSGLKPDAFHITLSKKKECDGRAFVEFANFRDFDLALKLHGSSFRDNIVCVKQTLYDEMVKILDAVKAKHHFETPVRASTSDVPEKVPYLWEPPDAYDEQNKPDFHNSWVEDQYPYSSNSSIKKKFHPTMGHNTVNETAMSHRFIRNDRMPIDRNFDPHFKHQIIMKQEIERVAPYITQNNLFNTKEKDFESEFREPIKFNVNKPPIINTKINETFESSKNFEKKSKLSKLSPEREDFKVSLHKEPKVSLSKTKDIDFKKKSPERKEINFKKKSPERRDSNSEKSFKEKRDFISERSFKERRDSNSQRNFKERRDTDSERYSRIGKHYKSGDTFSRNRYERETKQNYEVKIVSHHKSISPVKLSHSGRESKECVVRLSNVSSSVGTPDLVEFLREFVYYKDTISRRYTDEGEPTGDVRVTFYNKSEAELAIRALNGRHLKGIRINMFIV